MVSLVARPPKSKNDPAVPLASVTMSSVDITRPAPLPIIAILVNLFGGIVRTDLVAMGILDAYKNNILKVPVFARISGAQSEKARELLQGSEARLFDTVEEAINAVVLKVNNNN